MAFNPPEYVQDQALVEWMRLLPYMIEKGFDKDEYVMTYASYCVAVMQFEDAMNTINEHGFVVEGRNESLVKNPGFTILKEANERIAQGSRAFGFTPGDLAKLTVAPADSEDTPDWLSAIS